MSLITDDGCGLLLQVPNHRVAVSLHDRIRQQHVSRLEALPLLHEIIFKHRNSLAIEPQNAEYTCNLADTVAEMAALLSGPATDNLYQEAYGMWEQVLQQLQGTVNLTDRGDATVNYGNALVAHAARLSDGATGAYDLRCDFLLPHFD
jgi:hypothetical protein